MVDVLNLIYSIIIIPEVALGLIIAFVLYLADIVVQMGGGYRKTVWHLQEMIKDLRNPEKYDSTD